MELDPDAADTLVLSMHKEAMRDLVHYPYEAAALIRLALGRAEALAPHGLVINNLGLGLLLSPLGYLTADELHESVDRLAARGFVHHVDAKRVSIDPIAICVINRQDLPAQFRLDWNAAKASFPNPTQPEHLSC
ncbi:hypothetical protein [Streptomyces sp. S186]|uniref:hypothetical protein n=1 Tax=Streptomyces sp. S186 TaxID=3434395 RepID=UPI003F67A64E